MRKYCKYLILESFCIFYFFVFGQEQKLDFYRQSPEFANLVSKANIAHNVLDETVNLSISSHELEIGIFSSS